ncbi:hypothetical protein TNCV_3513041 [Trichonephila clavipes]|nr:hypothetical protein TNCV_3513041 [Trichonephila clavipes]
MIVQFRNEKVSNHGSIPITIDCNVVAFIVFEEKLLEENGIEDYLDNLESHGISKDVLDEGNFDYDDDF